MKFFKLLSLSILSICLITCKLNNSKLYIIKQEYYKDLEFNSAQIENIKKYNKHINSLCIKGLLNLIDILHLKNKSKRKRESYISECIEFSKKKISHFNENLLKIDEKNEHSKTLSLSSFNERDPNEEDEEKIETLP